MTKLKNYFIVILFSILAFSCKVGNELNSNDKPDFLLTIIPMNYPSDYWANSSVSLYFPERQYFHVLLTNKTDRSIKIWEEWNSWGFTGLSFEITYPDGRKVISQKRSHGWDKNYPSWIKIPPDRHYIFEVNFENDTTLWHYWTNSVLNEKGDFTICKLKAVYEIRESLDSRKENIWTGRIESEEEEIRIWHKMN